MSTVGLTNPLEPAQRTAARVAGFAYLFNYVTSVFAVLTLSRITGSGDFAEKARRVLASEHLYRTALASMAIGWIIIVILAFALYVTLEPVNKRLAQLALFFELGQSFVGAVTVVVSFAALRLYTLAQASGPFQNEQLQALVSVTRNASENSGFNIAMIFLGLGSTLFFYLFYKSRYIPRALAAFGVFASVVMAMVSLAILIFPEYAGTIQYGWGPMGITEITTAFWLMIVGIRPAPVQ
jgi:Domain of unknown function (DUF4386)